MVSKHKFRRYWLKVTVITIILLVAGVLWYLFRDRLDQDTIVAFSEQIPAFWTVVAFLFLPLFGVPIRIMLILAGFRFGFALGMVLSAFGLLFHNFAAYFIARGSFRDLVRDFLKRSGYAIPPIKAKHRIWFTALVVAIPGPPYFAKLYLLALTDLPLRVYAGIGAPIYILFSVVPVGIGGAVIEYEAKWFYLLAAAFLLITILGIWLGKRYTGGAQENNAGEAEKG